MTQPTPEQLEVAQADRDAAADRLESTIPEKFRNLHPATHTAKAIRKGKMDGHPWVQNYARHRILAIQATEARMAAAVEAERARCSKLAADYAASMTPTIRLGDEDSIYLTDHEQGQKDAAKRLSIMIYETAIRSQSNG